MTEATEKQIKFMVSLGLKPFQGMTMDTAKELIANALAMKEGLKPTVEKPSYAPQVPQETKVSSTGKFTTMYVSYAKDVFCSLMNDDKGTSPELYGKIMGISIALVKQAREAFE